MLERLSAVGLRIAESLIKEPYIKESFPAELHNAKLFMRVPFNKVLSVEL